MKVKKVKKKAKVKTCVGHRAHRGGGHSWWSAEHLLPCKPCPSWTTGFNGERIKCEGHDSHVYEDELVDAYEDSDLAVDGGGYDGGGLYS